MKKESIEKKEFVRVGTTLYKLVNQPRLNGGYVKKRIVWNNETLRQDYGKDYLATVPLIVTRPMMGTIPFFSLLPFT